MKFSIFNFQFYKFVGILSILFLLLIGYFVYTEIYTDEAQNVDEISFVVNQSEGIRTLSARLEKEGVIRSSWLFEKYLVWKGLDKKIHFGEFSVTSPITLDRVANAISQPGMSERKITIIPGWTIRETAQYFEREGMFQSEELTELVGLPAVDFRKWADGMPKYNSEFRILQDKPDFVSFEGYLAPETYQVYKNSTLTEIVDRLLEERNRQITDTIWLDISKTGHNFYEILTMASVLEKEVQKVEDRKKVADIFWRRYKKNWALQADSTVHYAVNKVGSVFTSADDRSSLSLWNTYKYPGLPLGPICNPSFESIESAIYPTKNDYWYFLTSSDGIVHYAKTLDEHNMNRVKYL